MSPGDVVRAPPCAALTLADSPRVEEIIAVMREAGEGAHGDRVRGLIVVRWRAGLRIAEVL